MVSLRDSSWEGSGGIEVVITSGLGDRETVTLQPAEKGRFRGRLPTRAGEPQAEDKVLQTQVGDEITLDYSPAARAKMNVSGQLAIKLKVVAAGEAGRP